MASAADSGSSHPAHDIHRFNIRHGGNVRLFEDRTVAIRTASFKDALVFSEKPLQPNELFLVEIEQNDFGWNGSLRIGISQGPHLRSKLPQFSIPGLTADGMAWVYTLDRTEVDDQLRDVWTVPQCKMHKLLRDFPRGCVMNFDNLLPGHGLPAPARTLSRRNSYKDEFHARLADSLPRKLFPSYASDTLQTSKGSRVGVFYTRPDEESDHILLYFVVNGQCRGPFPFHVDLDQPLFAVCDLYGNTKAVRICDPYTVPSLLSICRDSVLRYTAREIGDLPVPYPLKRFLSFQPR